SMADGDLSVRVAMDRPDEIGVLATSFNEMADQIQEMVVTLRRLVTDAAHELHTPLTALRTNLEMAADEANPQQQAQYLERALANLLDNALKFTPSGGEVTIALRSLAGDTEIAIEDTGIGIPEGDARHLFERFHRGRNAAGYAGSGLGLAIARAIINSHAGS